MDTQPPSSPVPSPHASIGNGDVVLQRAEDLIPALRERAEECERRRELPQATVEDIRRSGVHRVFQPARFGGSEAHFRIGVDILAALGRGCASTAWVVVQNMTHNLMLAHWPEHPRVALVTTGPNELVAPIHDRLALILHPRDYDRWLGVDDKGGDPRPPLDLLHPYDAGMMKMTPANPAVGNWRNNGPDMLNFA